MSKVRYIDYEEDSFSEGNVLFPYLRKRKSFSHEQELRAVFWDTDRPQEGNQVLVDVEPPDSGRVFLCDLSELIEEVQLEEADCETKENGH